MKMINKVCFVAFILLSIFLQNSFFIKTFDKNNKVVSYASTSGAKVLSADLKSYLYKSH